MQFSQNALLWAYKKSIFPAPSHISVYKKQHSGITRLWSLDYLICVKEILTSLLSILYKNINFSRPFVVLLMA